MDINLKTEFNIGDEVWQPYYESYEKWGVRKSIVRIIEIRIEKSGTYIIYCTDRQLGFEENTYKTQEEALEEAQKRNNADKYNKERKNGKTNKTKKKD